MHGFLRLLLFATVAAAGVAVAYCVANSPLALTNAIDSTDSAEADSQADPTASRPTLDDDVPPPTPVDTRPFRSIVAPIQLSAEPQIATIQPAVTQHVGRLEQQINEAREQQQQIAESLTDLRALADRLFTQAEAAPTEQPANEVEPLPPAATTVEQVPANDETALADVRPSDDAGLIINIQDADIREVLDLLSQHGGLNILASPSVQGTVSASLQDVDVLTALDAILRSTGFVARRDGQFLFVGTPEDFALMDHALDRVGTRIYRPNYATASELQQLITPMLSPTVGTISVSSPSQVGVPADGVAAGGDDFAGSEVLLVRDYEAVLHQIDQIVAEVDCQPLQVAIEAMILSVNLDDSNELGVNFELLRDQNNVRLVSGNPLPNLAAIDLNQNGGLKFGFLDSSLALFINALETIGDTNVIASPRLMCLNKQRAEILIGEQLGYVSTTVTENAATQSVEFLEVGTQLRIRPFISADGVIRMEVHPELSTGSVSIEQGFTLPDKEVTQVTTNIMCRDGATVIIGGLIREDLDTTASQIPLFGSLPVIGPAFRQETETVSRQEIIVLITPRIVLFPVAECQGAQAACEYQTRQAIYFDKMSCIGTRFYGQRYYRLARAAWYSGQASRALRYANLSVHFDPMNREAVTLRSEIIANSPYGDRTVDSHLREGLAPWSHPSGAHRLSPWLLEHLDNGPPPPTAAGELYAPGAPGTIRDLEARPAP